MLLCVYHNRPLDRPTGVPVPSYRYSQHQCHASQHTPAAMECCATGLHRLISSVENEDEFKAAFKPTLDLAVSELECSFELVLVLHRRDEVLQNFKQSR